MENIDILAKYEELFGLEHRTSLFDGDEQYAKLRQEIIDAPIQVQVFSKKLPFEDIKLIPYDEYKRIQVLREYEELNIQPFFIKKFEGNVLVSYGAGYFNIKISKFIVLRSSISVFNDYNRFLLETINSLRGNIAVENNTIQIVKNISFVSASLAASFILGKPSTFSEWRDNNGKSLNFYYTRFKDIGEDEFEYKSVPTYVEKVKSNKSVISQKKYFDNKSEGISRILLLLQSPLNNLIPLLYNVRKTYKPSLINLPRGKRIFLIKKYNCCYAYGFFDKETQVFYICKGSRVAIEETESYIGTASSKARKRFLSKYCTLYSDYYEVNKDIKCKSASAAACYVLGDSVDYSRWKDALGYYLRDAYPNFFFSSGEK